MHSGRFGFYPHIPHDEGLQAVKEALLAWDSTLDEGKKLGDLKSDIVDFTEIVLKNNNFEFDGKHFVQKLGTAIGTRIHRRMPIFLWTNWRDS